MGWLHEDDDRAADDVADVDEAADCSKECEENDDNMLLLLLLLLVMLLLLRCDDDVTDDVAVVDCFESFSSLNKCLKIKLL